MDWIIAFVAIYLFVGVIYFGVQFYLNDEYVDTALLKAAFWPKDFLLIAFKLDN